MWRILALAMASAPRPGMLRLFTDDDAALLELALAEVAAACWDLSRPAAPTQHGGPGAAVWPHGSRSSTGEGGSGDGVASPALAVAGSACLPGPRCGAGEDGSSVATTAARPSTAAPTTSAALGGGGGVPRAPARPSRPQSSSRWSSTARPTCGRWTSRPTPATTWSSARAPGQAFLPFQHP